MTPLLAQGLRTDRSFERMYRRHVGDVYRYALAVLRNQADAEDVTQTTFLNAYRAYTQGERPRQPQNWLITIAHNVCRQRFRQATRRPQEVQLHENAVEHLEEEDGGPTAEDLRRALSHLAFNQRAALVMRELEGRSYAEIAEILGTSVSAVETLIFRARRALREQLAGSLTCAEAERALSLEADGQLPRAEKGLLRAHLRECKACTSLARSQRAQRSAWKALSALPVPASLSSLFGGGGAVIGVKAAAVATSAVVAGGLGLAGERHFTQHPARPKPHPAAPAPRPAVAHRHAPAAVVQTQAVHQAPTRRAVPDHEHRGRHDTGVPPGRLKHEQGEGDVGTGQRMPPLEQRSNSSHPHGAKSNGHVSPGQAKKEVAGAPAGSTGPPPADRVPPGRAKKQLSQAPPVQLPAATPPDLPPGQLKKKHG